MKKLEIAQYAYGHVPFYQNQMSEMPERWEEIPTVSRKRMSEHMDQNLSPEYMMDYLGGRLDFVMTSGSTGQCLTVYWDSSQRTKSLLPLWMMRKKYYGITPKSRRCYFFTTKVIDNRMIDRERSKYGLGFSKQGLSTDKIVTVYKEMMRFEPEWLLLQPSMARLLVYAAKENHLPPLETVRYIELTGERIPDGARREIKGFFGCPVASQYGCYEVNSIAYECPCGNMHVMEENVFLEVLNPEQKSVWDEEGELYLTSLQNKVMPFIRYQVGDRGRVRDGSRCSCGNPAPIVELTEARNNDFIMNEDGSSFHSDILAHAVEMTNLVLEFSIVQYQMVQKGYSDFDIFLVLDDESEKNEAVRLFLQSLGTFSEGRNFHFYFPACLLPGEVTGKLAWFVSEVNREDKC